MIVLQGVTKRFSSGRGLTDLSFTVEKGEVFGYLGPNGAGKSTTIRHLLGFLRPDAGSAYINGKDCWTQAASIHEQLGYLPGETAFFDTMNGLEFLSLLGSMRKMRDTKRRDELIQFFSLEVKTPIRKMSKGMKQKLGLIAACMHRPQVLILDEPSSGLDPLMQQRFVALIEEEKKRGATMLLSSHVFTEVERVCDRVGILKDGRLVTVQDMAGLRQVTSKIVTVSVGSEHDLTKLRLAGIPIVAQRHHEVDVEIKGNYNELIQVLAGCDVHMLDVRPRSLEELFMHFYGEKEVENDELRAL
nr:ABC transporter ATP-binding protein [Bacilli bacterium]